MKRAIPVPATLIAALGASASFAQTPVGLWRTIDDASGKEKSLVRIAENAGVLTGKIEKLADPNKQDSKCDECSDARKGQPVLGMTILRNVRHNESDKALWDGGDILDPNNGKIYRVRLTPSSDNKKLEVRGYIGTPLLGRTQTWQRVE